MMPIYIRKLAVATVVSNFFLLIAAGHGVGPFVLIEVMAPTHPQPFIDSFKSLSLTSSYDQSAFSAVAIAMIGQIFAIISIIGRNKKLLLGSIFILWLSFFVLTHTLFKDDLAMFSFCTGLPFFSLSIVTFYLTLRDIKATD